MGKIKPPKISYDKTTQEAYRVSGGPLAGVLERKDIVRIK